MLQETRDSYPLLRGKNTEEMIEHTMAWGRVPLENQVYTVHFCHQAFMAP